MPGFVILRRFRDMPDALLAWSILDSAGLESFLFDEITVRMDWLWSNLLGGVRICVKAEDAEEGDQILKLGILERFNVEGVGEFEQPRCPQCWSLDISYEDLNKPVAYACTFLFYLPIPIHRQRWKCQTCGYIWLPTGENTMRDE
jgi:hypothetical protein